MEEQKIILANGSNINEKWFSEPLTEFAAGIPCDNVKKALDAIAPEVRAPRRFEFFVSNSGSFVYDNEEIREGEDGTIKTIHNGFARVETSGNVILAKMNTYGLTTVIEDDDMFFQEQAVEDLKLRLLTADLMRAAKLLDVLSGDAEEIVWARGNKNDPIKDIKALISSVGNSNGMNANKLLYGFGAWNMSCEYFGSDSPNYTLAPRDLAFSLGVDDIIVSNNRAFVNNDELLEEDGAPEYIIPKNKVYAFCSNGGVSRRDYSAIKRFVAHPFEVFSREKPGGLEISVYTTALIAQTGIGGVKAYKVSNS